MTVKSTVRFHAGRGHSGGGRGTSLTRYVHEQHVGPAEAEQSAEVGTPASWERGSDCGSGPREARVHPGAGRECP